MELDGSKYEGGGQILRCSVALAIIVKREIHIINIRAGRPKPGLSNQHIAGISLCCDICEGKLFNCHLGSRELQLIPNNIKSGFFSANAITAGSISLILQAAIPVLAFAKGDSDLRIMGGTDASFAPPIDYMSEVTKYYFEKMGLIYKGFYPKGGGIVKARISSLNNPLSSITLTNAGSLSCITGYAFVAGRVPVKIAKEMKIEAQNYFQKRFPECPVQIHVFQESPDHCDGSIATFMFTAHTTNDCYLSVSGISSREVSHKKLAFDACEKLNEYIKIGACCDDYMQDQIIILMALAKGTSTIRTGTITMHTKSAIYVAEHFFPVKFEIDESNDGWAIVRCTGIGFYPAD